MFDELPQTDDVDFDTHRPVKDHSKRTSGRGRSLQLPSQSQNAAVSALAASEPDEKEVRGKKPKEDPLLALRCIQNKAFAAQRMQVVTALGCDAEGTVNDRSRAGQVDKKVRRLCAAINRSSVLATTSSCSGRAMLSAASKDALPAHLKQARAWLYSTHDLVEPQALLQAYMESPLLPNLIFKYEGFVLHVSCADLHVAARLLNAAISSGYKNSGIVVSKSGKIMVGIRGGLGMEVPLQDHAKTPADFILHLAEVANAKAIENEQRIARFFTELCTAFDLVDDPNDDLE